MTLTKNDVITFREPVEDMRKIIEAMEADNTFKYLSPILRRGYDKLRADREALLHKLEERAVNFDDPVDPSFKVAAVSERDIREVLLG